MSNVVSVEEIADAIDEEELLSHIETIKKDGEWARCPRGKCRKHITGFSSLASHAARAHSMDFLKVAKLLNAGGKGKVSKRQCLYCAQDLFVYKGRKRSNTSWPGGCVRENSFWVCPRCAIENDVKGNTARHWEVASR